jgi:type II secretory pathway pseudopilin PulG
MDYENSSDSSKPSKSTETSGSKGGRKPVFTTTEERKQRNRQAQAAFRERRTEHIKELEELVATQKSDYQRLQAAHNQATDECLMLRYKNSLLERILLEKGIDVQAELYERRDTSYLDPIEGVSTLRTPLIGGPRHHPARKSVHITSTTKRSVDRNSNSPPSLATSPQSSGAESNLTPTTPASSPESTFRPAINVPEITAPQSEATGAIPQIQGTEMAAASILRKLKGNQNGSMRDTAAYFLSSFLDHIETLGKLTPTTSPLSSKNLLILD